jgi:hypothetical protein
MAGMTVSQYKPGRVATELPYEVDAGEVMTGVGEVADLITLRLEQLQRVVQLGLVFDELAIVAV